VSAFPEGSGRNRAMSLYAAIASGGASLGLVLGGVITQWESWRWAFCMNLPVGIAVAACTPFFLTETPRQSGHFDLAGAGLAFVPLTTSALAGVRNEDAGAASSMVNVTQQMGGAVGLAVLVTVFGAASRARLPLAAHAQLVHGMASAFTVATLFDVCALLVMAAAAMMTRRTAGAR
jgi:MFS transporter